MQTNQGKLAEFYSMEEAAIKVGLSYTQLRNLRHQGRVNRGKLVGGRVIYDKDDLEDLARYASKFEKLKKHTRSQRMKEVWAKRAQAAEEDLLRHER